MADKLLCIPVWASRRPGSAPFPHLGVPTTKTRVRERCRPGSARYLSGDAGMFICHVGGTFMPRFCILSGEKGRFMFKNAPVLSMAILAYVNINSILSAT